MSNLLTGPEATPVSGAKAKQLIMFLHGVGADGADLFSLKDIFTEQYPDAHFFSPNAPFACDMAPYGYQWFSLLDRAPEPMLAGVREAEPILNATIDAKLSELNLRDEDLIIIGFSQGTMTSLHTVYRREKPCKALIGYSGAMLADDLLDDELISRTPTCLIHGTADEVVPHEMMLQAEAALERNAIPHEAHSRPHLGHGIDPEGIKAALSFLQMVEDNNESVTS